MCTVGVSVHLPAFIAKVESHQWAIDASHNGWLWSSTPTRKELRGEKAMLCLMLGVGDLRCLGAVCHEYVQRSELSMFDA
jgi:hypothetical protein